MSPSNPEITQARAMLKQLAEMAEHASLTGALEDGQQAAARRYNAILAKLESAGAVASGLFSPIQEGAPFGEIGVEARLLASSLEPGPEAGGGRHGASEASGEPMVDPSVLIRLAPFMDSDDLGDLVRQTMKSNVRVSPEMLVALAPFLDSDDVGDLVRAGLMRVAGGPPAPPAPPAPPVPPAPPAPSDEFRGVTFHPEPAPVDAFPAGDGQGPGLERSGDLDARVAELAQRLGDPSLSPSERADLAAELARLSHVQAGH